MIRPFALLAAAAALLAPAPAGATEPSTHTGRCAYATDSAVSMSSEPSAVVVAVVALHSTDPAANPVTATVSCEVRIDGVTRSSSSATGTGVAIVGGRAQYYWGEGYGELCTIVDYADATPTETECRPFTTTRIPPEAFDPVYSAVNEVFVRLVDPTLCALLVDAPRPGDPVEIRADGDVYVAGQWVWDCPPYEPLG